MLSTTLSLILVVQLAYLADTFSLLDSVNELECTSVPPALWCQHPVLTKQCGFSELCDRYTQYTSGKRLNLTIFIYSVCHFAQNVIGSEQFVVTYTKMSKYVNVELMVLPYYINDEKLDCMSPPQTLYCKRHLQDVCALHFLRDQGTPYFHCFMKEMKDHGTSYEDATKKCSEKMKIGKEIQNKISKCAVGEMGKELLRKTHDRILSIGPDRIDKYGSPSLVFNNVFITNTTYLRDNIPLILCEWAGIKEKEYICAMVPESKNVIV